jgi:drug/metabolite transporter superfamily protein YnfA
MDEKQLLMMRRRRAIDGTYLKYVLWRELQRAQLLNGAMIRIIILATQFSLFSSRIIASRFVAGGIRFVCVCLAYIAGSKVADPNEIHCRR